MKFGKVKDISTIDFSLPPDAPGTRQNLEHWTAPDTAAFYIGCTGWSMKEWVGSIYPKGAKANAFLKHYGRQFNTIELNTTHYRIPTAAMIDKWYRETPDDFRFCPKVPQSISHSKNLGVGTGLIQQFTEVLAGLQEKMGCCFIQLPPYFGTDRLPVLEAFLQQFPPQIPLAIEVRHESWFAHAAASEPLFHLLEQHNIAAVLTDVAGRRDVLHMRLTTPTAMIRFVGNGLHETDFTRIDDWVQRLKSWIEGGVHTIYFFPHEPDNILAPQLADYLFQQITVHLQVKTRGPKLLPNGGEEQLSLF